jgi:ornithine cyclodeaminase
MPLWVSEAEVVSLMDLSDAIRALEDGLRMEAEGAARNMHKTHVGWDHAGEGTLHAIGAAFPGAGFAGTKTWAHTPGGATPLLVLFASAAGRLEAIIEAFALGQLRTAAASGVATRWLAARDADELAIVGTGKQALPQVAAILAVRPIRRVRVFGRDAARRAEFARRVRQSLEVEVVDAGDVAAAVRQAPIVTLVTRASQPFLTSDMVARGTHINAVGAITRSGAEIAPDVLPRCDVVVADSPEQARRLSSELIGYFGDQQEAHDARWRAVRPLAAVVAGETSRPPGADLTLFKALGMGVSDLALGIEVYRRAIASGAGRPIAHPERVQPRLHGSPEGLRYGYERTRRS